MLSLVSPMTSPLWPTCITTVIPVTFCGDFIHGPFQPFLPSLLPVTFLVVCHAQRWCCHCFHAPRGPTFRHPLDASLQACSSLLVHCELPSFSAGVGIPFVNPLVHRSSLIIPCSWNVIKCIIVLITDSTVPYDENSLQHLLHPWTDHKTRSGFLRAVLGHSVKLPLSCGNPCLITPNI